MNHISRGPDNDFAGGMQLRDLPQDHDIDLTTCSFWVAAIASALGAAGAGLLSELEGLSFLASISSWT